MKEDLRSKLKQKTTPECLKSEKEVHRRTFKGGSPRRHVNEVSFNDELKSEMKVRKKTFGGASPRRHAEEISFNNMAKSKSSKQLNESNLSDVSHISDRKRRRSTSRVHSTEPRYNEINSPEVILPDPVAASPRRASTKKTARKVEAPEIVQEINYKLTSRKTFIPDEISSIEASPSWHVEFIFLIVALNCCTNVRINST